MFTFLKLLFACVTPLISNYQYVDNDFNNSNEVVETKSRDNYFSTSDYLFLLANDFESSQFANDLFSNIGVLGTEFNNFPSDIPYPNELNDVISVTIGDPINGSVFGYFRPVTSSNSNGIAIYNSGYPVSSITFQKTYVNLYDNGQRIYYYDITLSGRYGNGTLVNYINYNYRFCLPLYYSSGFDTPTSLGNVCYEVVTDFISGSPINEVNYLSYVYQEYIGSGYPSPLYNAYYRGLDDNIDVITARQQGYNQGYSNGRDTGFNEGYQSGYTEGLTEGSASDGVPSLIFSGILNVALLPVDIFLQMFQYEVFGINIAGLISGLLTVAMVITVLRFVMGGKSKDD